MISNSSLHPNRTLCPSKKIFSLDETNTPHAQKILFPKGILGVNHEQIFLYASFSHGIWKPFQMLYNLHNEDASYIVIEANMISESLHQDAKNEALQSYGILPENLTILYIVSLQETEENFQITANLRAPIFVNNTISFAWQHILANPDLSIQHLLNHVETFIINMNPSISTGIPSML